MAKEKTKVLMVDRGKGLGDCQNFLGSNGTEVIAAKNTREARKKIQEESYGYVLLDRDTFNHLSSPHHLTQEISLKEYIEKRLHDYIKKFKDASGSNLYDALIREVEKPLLSMVLKETKGNQVHASQILGMNRNTLRKKIKELNIPLDS
jgi:DNA-binding protein Fis